ncbi:MAG: hypothetical protein H6734_02585 [Alphaproteobacteria bacterium]|nr:hypothetical protein [Alphaproteobacteria bacterium]
MTVDGALYDLDGVAEASRGRTWRILTHGGSTTGLDESNIAATRNHDYELLEVPLPPELEFTHLATAIVQPLAVDGVWLFGVCALDVDGEITCAGAGDMTTFPFTEGPYEDLQGYMGIACARRASDKVIVCSNGDVFDLGEVVTMSVDVRQHPGEDFDPALPSVCAITADNAIRCAGPLYPADHLEQLEALPR